MTIKVQNLKSGSRWLCKDVAGIYATVHLDRPTGRGELSEINTYLHRVHLDEEEARELLTALQEAFIEKEQKHEI